jgi:hypothetical protein
MLATHATRPRAATASPRSEGAVRGSVPVRPAHDVHEGAADRAATRLMGGETTTEQGRPVGPGAGMLRGLLRSGGEPLPAPTRGYFESRLGRDLSDVRIHAGAAAGASARAIGAKAYTLGSDIAFAPGRYQPWSAAGQSLLAHELAHVAQQSGGAPELGLGAAPLGVQRAVETLGGTWSTDTYELTYSGGAHIGCRIASLHFTPGEGVDATQIGLVQSVNSIKGGTPFPIHETAGRRSLPAGDPEAGLQIDRLGERRNPVYGMNDPPAANQTLGGSVSGGLSQYGFRYRLSLLGLDIPVQQDATLQDAPSLGGHGPNSSQLFETTALALAGAQAGTFYGSVRWGWRSDAADTPTLEPLSVVSVGVPSAGFRRTSDLWNRTKTSTGADPLQMPIAGGSANAKLPRDMTTGEIMDRLRQIERERAITKVGNTIGSMAGGAPRTLETLDFEERALRRELLNRAGDFPTPRPGDPVYA